MSYCCLEAQGVEKNDRPKQKRKQKKKRVRKKNTPKSPKFQAPIKLPMAHVKPLQALAVSTSSYTLREDFGPDRPPTPRPVGMCALPPISEVINSTRKDNLATNGDWESHSEPDIDVGLELSSDSDDEFNSNPEEVAQTQTSIITLSDSDDESNTSSDDEKLRKREEHENKDLLLQLQRAVQYILEDKQKIARFNIFSPDLPMVRLIRRSTDDLRNGKYSLQDMKDLHLHLQRMSDETETFASHLRDAVYRGGKESLQISTLQNTLTRKRLIVSSSEESDDNQEIITMLTEPKRAILCANCHENFPSKAAFRRHLYKNPTDCTRTNSQDCDF